MWVKYPQNCSVTTGAFCFIITQVACGFLCVLNKIGLLRSNTVLVCSGWCFSWMLDAVKPLFYSGWCSLLPVSVSSSCLKFLSPAHGNCFNLPKLLGYVLCLLHCHIYFPIFDFSSFSFLHMVALILLTTNLLFPSPFYFIQKVRSLPVLFFFTAPVCVASFHYDNEPLAVVQGKKLHEWIIMQKKETTRKFCENIHSYESLQTFRVM